MSLSLKTFAAIDLNINSNTASADNTTDIDNIRATNTQNPPQQQYGNEIDSIAPMNVTESAPDSSPANVSNLSSVSESDVGLNNIFSIILIAIGVVLVFLGIAVLIRIKEK